MIYPKNMPNDYRRNLYNLEMILETAEFYPDGDDGTDRLHSHIGTKDADAMTGQLKSTPRDVLVIQTANGRYQITVGADLTVVALDAGKNLVMQSRSSNVLVLTQRFD